VTEVLKVHEGRPNIVDLVTNGDVHLVINTPFGRETRSDGYHIRAAAIRYGVSNITTVPAAQASVQAIEAIKEERLGVSALQDLEQWVAPAVRDSAAANGHSGDVAGVRHGGEGQR
jgi:carbamoyl-phosphate synthase large subunit